MDQKAGKGATVDSEVSRERGGYLRRPRSNPSSQEALGDQEAGLDRA